MRPVAVVQHEPSVPPGNIAGVLEERGTDYLVVEAWREQRWPSAADLAGVVVLGGTMNVDELDRYPFLRRGRALVAGAIEQDLPVLGVCLGAQMMTRVLGGDVYRSEPRNALFSKLEIGDDGPADPLIAPFAQGVPVLQFHEDTFTIPPGAIPLARSAASGLHQAFRFGERAYAIQFHFEADESILRGWCTDIGEAAMADHWRISTADLMADAADHLPAQERAGRELFNRWLVLASTGL